MAVNSNKGGRTAFWDELLQLRRRQYMRKVICVVFGFIFYFLTSAHIFSHEYDILKKADDLDWDGRYRQEKDFLLEIAGKTSDTKLLTEIYWRTARATFYAADTDCQLKRISKDEALRMFEEGEEYANKAIGYDVQNPSGYFWKATNICLWGQTRGAIASLTKMASVSGNLKTALKYEPGLAEAYYVLGQIYEKAPGWPISLGNVEYAVSLGRKSIDLMEMQIKSGRLRERIYGFDIALTSHLWARNWDAQKRVNAAADQRRQFEERQDIAEKNFFYEGKISIPNISDRDEARLILAAVIAELEKMTYRTVSREIELGKARELLSGFK